MVCRSCGKEIQGNSSYCPECGAKNAGASETMRDQKDPYQYYQNNSMNAVTIKGKQITPRMAFVISFIATIVISAIVFGVLAIIGAMNNKGDNTVDRADTNESLNVQDVNTLEKPKDNAAYEYKYSYTELSDVVSLDSDPRFVYSAAYTVEGVVVYTYLFQDQEASDSDFIKAVDEYSLILQEVNGFVYEEEYTLQQYEETGDLAIYLTRDNYGMSVTADIQASSYYAYVSIFPLMGGEDNQDQEMVYDMPNYNTYLADREIKGFTFDQTVDMENGLSFIITDVTGNSPGDGSMTIEITMDLGSWYSDYYFNNGDFMILPVDNEDKVLSDAIPITLVVDSAGSQLSMPFLMSTSYETYTFVYNVPANTSKFLIYGTNYVEENPSSPVYVMDVGY